MGEAQTWITGLLCTTKLAQLLTLAVMAACMLTLAWAVAEEVGTWQHIDPWKPVCPHSIHVTQG